MRTYDDTFSGTKIYPGKVSAAQSERKQESAQWGTNHGNAMDFEKELLTVCLVIRASSMSAVTARSSASRMARPNLSSFSERTLEE